MTDKVKPVITEESRQRARQSIEHLDDTTLTALADAGYLPLSVYLEERARRTYKESVESARRPD